MLKPEVEAVVEAAIDEFYLDQRCPTIADLMSDIARRRASKDLKSPTYNSVVQRVRARDQREVFRRRKGAAYARGKLGRIVGRLSEDEPLGLVQIDHTLADVIMVSEADR